ncbi:hypothetical protein SAMN05216548_101216 [Faunimonas pinastri]|uniref:Uncharacterized protein n=1 Tax=Faunimonas pinastri TaxID=1855383 RepID=A0A1H8ZQJ6_9HYPH|nr:hypothetical protein [Faunimonas pinastri]SEP66655.1 hypothetical protein SAMN05216548_101216 [Faunimonas pinastri]
MRKTNSVLLSGLKVAVPAAMAMSLAGCMGMGSGGTGTAATPTKTADKQVDPRTYLGPDYCPAVQIREGTQILQRFPTGKQGDPNSLVWQASIGDAVRECLYNPDGTLTLRIGVSGRIISGPKGTPGHVSAPLRVAVVKYQEKVFASNIYPVAADLAAGGNTVFREVHEVTVPSPGDARDYLIYVGFDESSHGLDPTGKIAKSTKAVTFSDVTRGND